MRNFPSFSLALTFLLTMPYFLHGRMSFTNHQDPVPVRSVQLKKYIGLWYEIAKIPNRFQRKCAKNTIAEYTLRDDGRIDVINKCARDDGNIIQAKGIAKIIDTQSNAKLKVSFVKVLGMSLFWGDYWILGLDENYQWAVIGEPSRKYGWILGRTQQLSKEDWEKANIILRDQGYDPDRFIKTLQAH